MSGNKMQTTGAPPTPLTVAEVLVTGDLSKLTVPQRNEYYMAVCKSLGLNPLTRPFRFLMLSQGLQLYPTKDCTDQLRMIHGISNSIVKQDMTSDLYVVTVKVTDKNGREDSDIGAVTLGKLYGDARANAMMKAVTKAKRRATLSICGLGMTDESEIETIPGAKTYDIDAEIPAQPAPESKPEPTSAKSNGSDNWTLRSVWIKDTIRMVDAPTNIDDKANALRERLRPWWESPGALERFAGNLEWQAFLANQIPPDIEILNEVVVDLLAQARGAANHD